MTTTKKALRDIATDTDPKLRRRSYKTVQALVEAGLIQSRTTGTDIGTDWRFVLTEAGTNLLEGR